MTNATSCGAEIIGGNDVVDLATLTSPIPVQIMNFWEGLSGSVSRCWT